MIIVVLLLFAPLVIMAFLPSRTQPLNGFERTYVLVSGVPVVTMLILPNTFVGQLVGELALLVVLGAALSFVLIPAGFLLIYLRHKRTRLVDRRLAVACLIAAAPIAFFPFFAIG